MDRINFKNKIILVIGAHPDDNDFGSAGTSAKAVKEGAKVFYLIATKGQRGGSGKKLTSEKLARIRDKEQQAAAKILGVKKVHFLDFFDGELVADLKLKEQIVIFIRKYKPDYVFTMDPSHFYYKKFGFINHSDHRAVGEAALDACYPLARDLLSFPKHQKMGLKPHKVREIFLASFSPDETNCFVDITKTLPQKIKALSKHRSQFPDFKLVRERITERAAAIGKIAGVKYAEGFVRLKLR
jgi:LmbE family N-acetylglucosaminyl deacetylase